MAEINKAIITEEYLINIIRKYSPSNPLIVDTAKSILIKYQELNTTKCKVSSFDINNRVMGQIQEEYSQLLAMLPEIEDVPFTKVAELIANLLKEIVPTYDNLIQAYKLANSRGMKDDYIEQHLRIKVNNDEVKVKIAALIEFYIINLPKN